MKLRFEGMATLVDEETGKPYVTMAFYDEKGNYQIWNMYHDEALAHHFDFALCVHTLRDIEAKQKRAQETTHGDLQYAESRSFFEKDFDNA